MAIIEIFPLEELETIMDFLVLQIEVNYSKDLFKQVPQFFQFLCHRRPKFQHSNPQLLVSYLNNNLGM